MANIKNRAQRRDVIRKIVRQDTIRTQRDMAERLQEAGYDCTQATISRDIADMGLLKSEAGYYVLPEDQRLTRMVSELVEDINTAGHLVVISTYPGGAASVAGAIDDVSLEGVLGSVAGDDTIFIAVDTSERASNLKNMLDGLRRR